MLPILTNIIKLTVILLFGFTFAKTFAQSETDSESPSPLPVTPPIDPVQLGAFLDGVVAAGMETDHLPGDDSACWWVSFGTPKLDRNPEVNKLW